jgi:hypothetical protein
LTLQINSPNTYSGINACYFAATFCKIQGRGSNKLFNRVKQTSIEKLFGGLMKQGKIAHLDDGRFYYLTDEKMISFDARKIQIECRQGVVWVTWPDGNERVLKKGQAMAVVSKGLIIVQAFALSTIVVRNAKTKVSQLCVPCQPAESPAR